MHRARLSEEASLEPLRHSIRLRQYLEETAGLGGVVTRMDVVFGERDRASDFDWTRPELYANAEASEHTHVFVIEVGHTLRSQRHVADRAVARPDDELMLDKIELHIERPETLRDRRGGQAPGTEVERHVPPVVLCRRKRQLRLADDLHPHVKRVVGLAPPGEWQRGGPGRRVMNHAPPCGSRRRCSGGGSCRS